MAAYMLADTMLTSLDFGMVRRYTVANKTMRRPQSVKKMYACLRETRKNPRCSIKRRRSSAYDSQTEWLRHKVVFMSVDKVASNHRDGSTSGSMTLLINIQNTQQSKDTMTQVIPC